jgi:hypothetical protein
MRRTEPGNDDETEQKERERSLFADIMILGVFKSERILMQSAAVTRRSQ